jgi:MFS superfamily sulfate permease-like transporter
MKRKLKYYRLLWLKYDLPAGLSVFFVALPLCLGIALASGAPLYSGIVSGIVGGLIVSLISGSPLSVSGPAAGLTTIVAGTIGNFNLFLLAVMVAGIFQLALGLLKLGSIANYFPSSVIKGMLAAIGIMLIIKQIPVALGYDQPDFWTSGIMNVFKGNNLSAYIHYFIRHTITEAIVITITSLIILTLVQRKIIPGMTFVPAPLLVVIVAVLIDLLFVHLPYTGSLRQTQRVNILKIFFHKLHCLTFQKYFPRQRFGKMDC